MSRRYFVAESGAYLGNIPDDLGDVPEGAVEIEVAPPRADAMWNGAAWESPGEPMARFYVDAEGRCLGAWTDPAQAPDGATAVATLPLQGTDRWDGIAWRPDVATVIERRCREVEALREAKCDGGMAYGGKVLQLREIDQQRIIAAGAQAKFALITGRAWPAQFGWIMADNSVLPLSADGMSTMADAAASQVQTWIFTGHAHKQALRALNDAAAVAAYDITTGW